MGYRAITVASTGRFSPLRYPGGKGKLAGFVANLIRQNGLSDGTYVEPYAGGAAIAWELLLTGVVRWIEINDISRPIYAFWKSALADTDALCALIRDTPITLTSWDRAKAVFMRPGDASDLDLGFAVFFLNRTNRSGILNGGIIGGRAQTGRWKADARYNKQELIERIERIASVAGRARVTQLDAVQFLETRATAWGARTLVYLDPPYFIKGGQLYYHSYKPGDHAAVAEAVAALPSRVNWMVSYDDVPEIRRLYQEAGWLSYSIGYSARDRSLGDEVMFLSSDLTIPPTANSMVETDRGQGRYTSTRTRHPEGI